MSARAAYSVSSLAERWDCTPDVIYRLVRTGQLQAFRLGGKLLRVRVQEVERFESQTTASSPIEDASLSPTATASEVAFESRLARMTEGLPKLALATSGTRGTGRNRSA